MKFLAIYYINSKIMLPPFPIMFWHVASMHEKDIEGTYVGKFPLGLRLQPPLVG